MKATYPKRHRRKSAKCSIRISPEIHAAIKREARNRKAVFHPYAESLLISALASIGVDVRALADASLDS